MSKSLMIQGTGSGVGKSLIVAGLCRIFRNMGIHIAPFKAQNMSLNSFITKEGGEIGRAQALQAEAARIEPSVDMNPILLKASGETGCQVIMNGRVHSNMKAYEYYAFKKEAWMAVTRAYERLSKKYDLIMIEGAGSPAEINLRDDEVVNMRVARHADSSVILVGDIDKGGVFASFYGTIGLLNGDADYIKSFIINKFRGDVNILKPGLSMIQEKTGRPVIGVIPHLGDLCLHEEDGIPLERLGGSRSPGFEGSRIKIVVLQLRYIANFTDFDPFIYEPDVELMYSLRDGEIKNADLIIIPGSKNTVKDLLFLRENGIEESIKRAVKKGIPLIGICGGYQMLGKRILDPSGIESCYKEMEGFGLLDIETTIEDTKITSQVEACILSDKMPDTSSPNSLRGYEIHMGRSSGNTCLFKLRRLSHNSELIIDGSVKGNVWGTYIHGIFDNDQFRHGLINSLRTKRGLRPIENIMDYSKLRDEALNKWAKILKENIDMKFIEGLINGTNVRRLIKSDKRADSDIREGR
ncbi:MAG: cobyric acid synthase [Nitrospira sp.]|nr:cobyric acid synthase [Nitrospira sp.]